MAILESKFDILRGWPNGGAVAHEVKQAGTTGHNPQSAGKWVLYDDASASPKLQDAAAASSATTFPVLVLEGLEDGSASISGTCTVLVGGQFIARLENKAANGEMFDGANNGAALMPGKPVAVIGNVIAPAAAADDCVGWVVGNGFANGTGLGTLDVYIAGPRGDAGGAANPDIATNAGAIADNVTDIAANAAKLARLIVEIQAVGNGDAATVDQLKTALATVDDNDQN